MRKLISGLSIVVLALGTAGCGGIDSGEAEDLFQGFIEDQIEGTGGEVESVDCPEDIENETGTTFECTAEFNDGSSATCEGEVTDEDEGTVVFRTEDCQGG